ncbi:hypothetical protein ACHAXN_007477 [Cyclotella atomus]
MLLLLLLLVVSTIPHASSFASFFVDRRTSCFTSLLVDEVIMNHPVQPHSSSNEGIYLRVEPSDDAGSFAVEFILPSSSSLRDVQYVLELSEESEAKFTSPPARGGIGCGDKRVYGKPGDGSFAVLKINDDAAHGSAVEIRGGWATGHEAVTLVEPVIMTIGEDLTGEEDGDDAYEDDQAEAEHEENILEEEREELQEEIMAVEKDVIEALEEKRLEKSQDSSDINMAEQDVVQALEEKRQEMNQALNSVKDEIIIDKAHNTKLHEDKMREMHLTDNERREIRQQRAQELKQKNHDIKQQLQHMEHHLPQDSRARAKLEHFQKMRQDFEGNEKVLRAIDKQEHLAAAELHRVLPPNEVDIDTEKIKETVHKHQLEMHAKSLQEMHTKMEEDMYNMQRSGVHEMIQNRHVKAAVDKLQTHLKKGLPRGGEAYYTGENGRPLSHGARYGLLGLFGIGIFVGVVRWGLDKRRWRNKGHVA